MKFTWPEKETNQLLNRNITRENHHFELLQLKEDT